MELSLEQTVLMMVSLIFVSPVYSLAVLTTQLNERRAPLFRPNTGQSAGARQGKNAPPPHQLSSCCWDTLTELQENDAIVFSEETLGCFSFLFLILCLLKEKGLVFLHLFFSKCSTGTKTSLFSLRLLFISSHLFSLSKQMIWSQQVIHTGPLLWVGVRHPLH